MPIRPGGGYGATICAQSDAGVETMPWPFGPASSDPELVGDGDQLVLGAGAVGAGLAVARGGDERGPHALAMRTPGGAPTFAPGGVHTNTRSAASAGRSSTDGRHREPEHLAALEAHRVAPGPRSRSGGCCAG